MPRWLAKFWVRFFGRKPNFLKDLTFITSNDLSRWLSPIREALILQIFERDKFSQRLRSTEGGDCVWLENVTFTEVLELTGARREGGLTLKMLRRVLGLPILRSLVGKPIIELIVQRISSE